MFSAVCIRFIAQVSLKAIRGEVAIYYGVPRASITSQMRLIRFLISTEPRTIFSRAATLRVGDKIFTLQVATGAGAMCWIFICDALAHGKLEEMKYGVG